MQHDTHHTQFTNDINTPHTTHIRNGERQRGKSSASNCTGVNSLHTTHIRNGELQRGNSSTTFSANSIDSAQKSCVYDGSFSQKEGEKTKKYATDYGKLRIVATHTSPFSYKDYSIAVYNPELSKQYRSSALNSVEYLPLPPWLKDLDFSYLNRTIQHGKAIKLGIYVPKDSIILEVTSAYIKISRSVYQFNIYKLDRKSKLYTSEAFTSLKAMIEEIQLLEYYYNNDRKLFRRITKRGEL